MPLCVCCLDVRSGQFAFGRQDDGPGQRTILFACSNYRETRFGKNGRKVMKPDRVNMHVTLEYHITDRGWYPGCMNDDYTRKNGGFVVR